MQKLLARTKQVVEKLSDTFNLKAKIEVGTDDDGNETLEIDGWITACIEMERVDVGPWKGHDVPRVAIYVASFRPATRWEPEDVDVDRMESHLSAMTAGRSIINMVIHNAMNGICENLGWEFDDEDYPRHKEEA